MKCKCGHEKSDHFYHAGWPDAQHYCSTQDCDCQTFTPVSEDITGAWSFPGQPPFSPSVEISEADRQQIEEWKTKFLDSQIEVRRDLIGHLSLAFTQGAVAQRNALIAQVESLESRLLEAEKREAAVFAKGYRVGFWDGSRGETTGGTTAFQSEVDGAYTQWVAKGKPTHLDERDAV